MNTEQRELNKVILKLEDAHYATKKALDNYKEMETSTVIALEHIEEELDDRIGELKYFTLKTEEDILDFDISTQRFLFQGDELTCGSSLEVYKDNWNIGRVESSAKYKTEANPSGYYFYNKRDDHFALESGMKVRRRIK